MFFLFLQAFPGEHVVNRINHKPQFKPAANVRNNLRGHFLRAGNADEVKMKGRSKEAVSLHASSNQCDAFYIRGVGRRRTRATPDDRICSRLRCYFFCRLNIFCSRAGLPLDRLIRLSRTPPGRSILSRLFFGIYVLLCCILNASMLCVCFTRLIPPTRAA